MKEAERPQLADEGGVADRIRGAKRRRQARAAGAFALFACIAAVAYCLMLGLGAVKLSPLEVIDVLTGGGSSRAIRVVWDLRLPVAVATVLIGAALGMAGSWTQTMARNPLASPDVLGVAGGAAVAVVAGTVVARPAFSEGFDLFWWRAGLALVGAAVVVLLLLLLGGFGTTNRVVLVGFALSLMCSAVVQYLIMRADLVRAADAQTWLAGSTGLVRAEALPPLVLGLLPFLAAGLWCGKDLAMLAHDDATASSLGVRVRRVRAVLLVAATGVVAVVVSVVGPIGFVALIAPQLGRLVAGQPTPTPWVSAAAGAALLTSCSVIAGLLPVNSPVGLVTSALGGVVLVVLVWRAARAEGKDMR